MTGVVAQSMGTFSESTRRAALHAAFHLVEAVQLPEVGHARTEIAARLAEAERSGWSETIATLLFAKAVDAVTNLPDEADAATERLIERAEGLGQTGMLAAGLALRAALALREGDVVRHLADTSRAVVLLDADSEPLARGSGFIAAGTAYEALSLWELGDELHTQAEALLPLCDDELLRPVIEINRGLTWFWWTAGLLEVGEYEKAEQLLRERTEDLLTDLPASWAVELRISRLAGLILMRAADAGAVEELRELGGRLDASEAGPNWLPRMLVCLGLAHDAIHAGQHDLATRHADCARELARVHGTVYQRSFADWTAMLIEKAENPTVGAATRAYAAVLARQRWDERIGRLASARAQIHGERQRGQHDGLVRRTLEDPLTGLGNRRALDQRLSHERNSLREDAMVAMVIVDVDQFKKVNDRFGHAQGDAVLCRVGEIIRSVLRTEDLCLRLGGDEFCAVITGAPADIVQARADRIAQLVNLEDWRAIQPGLRVTVSVGAASATGPRAVDDLYPRADAALYAAKDAGAGFLRVAL
jgi:diguanylate cyclase (GGDEF)-like protein